MKLRATFAAALSLGCTETTDTLDIETQRLGESTELEFLIIPPLDEVATDQPPPALEPPPTPLPTPARWEMWRVIEHLEDPVTWLDVEIDMTACDVELPRFPTIAADHSVLAVALISSPVADEELLTVRMLRAEDGKQMRAYTLVGPGESELPPEELTRRVCHRQKALARALDSGGHTTMPIIGSWQNPIRDGLPDTVDGWPKMIANGATREVDMAVADIVIAPADAEASQLQVRVDQTESCSGASEGDEQFSKVWEAAGLRLFTRGPCGC